MDDSSANRADAGDIPGYQLPLGYVLYRRGQWDITVEWHAMVRVTYPLDVLRACRVQQQSGQLR